MIIGAYVTNAAPQHPAGAEWALHDTMAWLATRGHDCRIVAEKGNRRERVDGVMVYSMPEEAEVAAHFQACDVMLTQMESSLHAQILAAKHQVPLVHLIHGAGQLDQIVPSCCALAVFNTDEIMLGATWRYANCSVLHPVVNEERVRIGPMKGKATTLVGMSHNKGAIDFYRLAQSLHHLPFMGVMNAYGDQEIRPDGIIGHGDNPIPTGLPSNMRVFAPFEDIREPLAYTRTLLMLSKDESYGRIAAEAIANGIPVIACRTPGVTECLGVDWPLYINGREETLALERLVKQSYTDEWEAWSKLARDRAAKNEKRQLRELRAFHAHLKQINARRPRMEFA